MKKKLKMLTENVSARIYGIRSFLHSPASERGEQTASTAAITALVLLIILAVMAIFRTSLISAFQRIASLLGGI